MRFFKQKLTDQQELELGRFLAETAVLCGDCRSAFVKLWTELQPLYAACSHSLTTGSAVTTSEQSLTRARDAVSNYLSVIRAKRELLKPQLPIWYPKKTLNNYRSLVAALEVIYKMSETVNESLEPPAFSRQSGKDKLNMFVSGLNLVADMQGALTQFK